MIIVLKNWGQLGEAVLEITRHGLPLYPNMYKNFDHCVLMHMLSALPARRENIVIVDMGCGTGETLRFLSALGYRSLLGLDARMSLRLMLGKFVNVRHKNLAIRYNFKRRDILRSGLKSKSCDLITCISVIEHGVDIKKFMFEMSRILRPGGILYLTTDYWAAADDKNTGIAMYGRSWRLMNQKAIRQIIAIAESNALELLRPGLLDLDCEGPVVCHGGREYTFIAMVFKKAAMA